MAEMSEQVQNKRSFFRQKRAIIIVLLCLTLASGIAIYGFHARETPIPKAVRAQVTFPLYYPGSLPQGWRLDTSSFYVSNSIVGYLIKGPSANLNMTTQLLPEDFDITLFYTKRLANTIQFTTPLGEGAIGKADNSFFVGSLVIGNSWVLATPSASGVSPTDMQFILTHLKKSHS